MNWALGWAVIAACSGVGSCQSAPDVPNLVLDDHLGVTHAIGGETGSRVVLFVAHGVGCPISRKSAPMLASLRAAYGDEVMMVQVNANLQDSAEMVVAEVEAFDATLPVLIDSDQQLARSVGFTRTAEAAVVETETWKVRYRGALDDRLEYGMEKPEATRHYVRDAIDSVLAGRPVAVPQTEARGCVIALK